MKNYEQYKRIVKCLSALVILLLETGIYWLFWMMYYQKVMQSPFFRRGNWLMAALYIVLLYFFSSTYGAYKIGVLKKGNIIYSQILSIVFTNVITYFQIALLDRKFSNPAIILLLTIAEALVITAWAFAFQWMYQKLFPSRKMLLVYGERPVFHLLEKVNSREDRYQIVSAVHINAGIEKIMEMAPGFGAVIIGDIGSHERNQILKECFAKSIRTYSVPKISDIMLRTSEELNIFDSPLLLSRNDGLQIEQLFIKRLTDIIFSAIGLVLTSPLFLIFAIAIKATDRGPVFYTQTRLTKDKKEFTIYKFRTMIQNAEEKGTVQLATEHDDRILPVGKLLRRTRLDELPQLYNILIGDMSMVGPRPERPEWQEAIEREIPEFAFRTRVKAGLTGYAQIYGKYNTTFYDKLKLDMTYIRKYSVWLDIKLMLMTPKIMFMKESTEGVDPTQQTAVTISGLEERQEDQGV